MKKHIITLGGLPGSGKSTMKRLLAERLGYKVFSTGDFVRNMAFERNLSLAELNDLIAKDKSLDHLIDDRLKHIEEKEDFYVVDSHLAFHFIPSGFSVFLDITPETAARRIFHDAQSPTRIKAGETMKTMSEAYSKTKSRVENHIDRYARHYGINPYDEKNYSFVISTEESEPGEAVERIVAAYEAWLAA
ncbi:MAG TPA: AAA family ATPase [Candidatus Paceibacterota bacterium]|nr:AAA family ATPase [Candidatus Paceibacterota bacterium]